MSQDDQELTYAVASVLWISNQMLDLRRGAAAFVQRNRARLDGFVRFLYKELISSPGEDLEIQLAVATSYAAHLHAEYASFSRQALSRPWTGSISGSSRKT